MKVPVMTLMGGLEEFIKPWMQQTMDAKYNISVEIKRTGNNQATGETTRFNNNFARVQTLHACT